jgi:hypothetical protein
LAHEVHIVALILLLLLLLLSLLLQEQLVLLYALWERRMRGLEEIEVSARRGRIQGGIYRGDETHLLSCLCMHEALLRREVGA